ncbi:hypothetical protein GCM10018963_32130 [Saccharothrix longispora]
MPWCGRRPARLPRVDAPPVVGLALPVFAAWTRSYSEPKALVAVSPPSAGLARQWK